MTNKEAIPQEAYYPTSPDQYGCLSAAYAFGLSELGRYTTPQEIDLVSGRQSNQLPTSENEIDIDLWLFDQGFKIECICPPNLIDMEKYFTPGTTLTFEDFKAEMFQVYGEQLREFYETTYTEREYASDMAYRREVHSLFNAATEDGSYIVTKADVDPEMANKLMGEGVVILDYKNGTNTSCHAVVLREIIEDNGLLSVGVFNPGPEKSGIDYFTCISLGEIFELNAGVTVIRPSTSSK